MPRHVAHHGVALEASLTRAIPLLLLALLLPSGCDGGDTDPTGSDTDTDTDTDTLPDPGDPVVVVEGAFMLALGETATLTARTVNASDENYTWATSDPQVLTISDDGEVSAVGLGSATITATGDSTDLQGELGITVTQEVPYLEAWSLSGHADRSAEAFRHWDEEPDIPATCAGCHSRPGFLDRIGADGSTPDVVDSAHPQGSVVDCQTCHHPDASSLDHVVFPSGVRVGGLDEGARCMTCHQGRSSSDDVEAAIAEAGVDADTVSEDLGFINIHYYAAGATLFAGEVRGGAQYEGQVYDWRFRHVDGVDSCTGCHDPHSLKVRVDTCAECHPGVESLEDTRDIRMLASYTSDYDGDGDLDEGLYHEVVGLRDTLLTAIQAYPTAQGNPQICFGAAAYPYWFVDGDGDGTCSDAEANYGNRYVSWTPRLLRAAYNYQVAAKDPGAWAHNGKYVIQLLHDSISDLNGANGGAVDVSALTRNDPGHFNGAGEAARHWDDNATVRGSCSRCHGGVDGLTFYLEYGVGSTSVAPDNGLECATCHTSIPGWDLREVSGITFPNGVTLDGWGSDHLCGSCHVGRESAASVDAAIASGNLSFKNVHYLPAAATRAGSDAGVGYQYAGHTYADTWTGHPGGDRCTDCHNPVETGHSFQVTDAIEACSACHLSATAPEDIKGLGRAGIDYDGDGNDDETLKAELGGLASTLFAQLQTTAAGNGTPICYDSHAYPYWFADTNGNGTCDGPSEANYGNQFRAWTPALLKASFNYQFWAKEPGAYAHNFDYSAQILIDSIEDLGGSTEGLTRP